MTRIRHRFKTYPSGLNYKLFKHYLKFYKSGTIDIVVNILHGARSYND